MTSKSEKIMRRRFGRRNGGSSITCTKNEPYALSYYFYTIFEEKANSLIINEQEWQFTTLCSI